ncbi:MAG: Hsp70 family protein [Deltaproteobacteria bacterium]|nr:Hsp70 family protein [Deltaproteobacteria bacterium]
MINTERIRQTLNAIKESPDQPTLSSSLLDILRELPRKTEYIDLFEQCLYLMNKIEDPSVRRNTLLDFVKDIPRSGSFNPLYKAAMESLIIAADALREGQHRINELLRIAHALPKTEEFADLRLLAWRLALNLPDKPRYKKPSLDSIARELPKACDYSFYRRYTLLGVAGELPKEGVFLNLYKEAVSLATDATAVIEEPYSRKYILLFIANELRKSGEFPDIYRRALTEAYKAVLAIKDPFAREHALFEIIRELPKSREFSELLMDVVDQALNFFTVRKWMEDIEATDVVDYILSAEEPGIKESKKRRFSREKYSDILSAEIDKFGGQLNDIRFIETLRPYTHIWIQPKRLRDSVRKVVAHLESLQEKFHGREIERPIFLKEVHPGGTGILSVSHRLKASATPVMSNCISIDIGATNTVIMRKKGDEQPEFIVLPSVAKKYDSVYVIPTILSSETNSIGAEVVEVNPLINIKQMLLERNPKGRVHMERFFRTLYQHLKKATVSGGWFSIASRNMADIIYITVPVGFQYYKKAMREIAEKTIRGVDIEFIEEPLAAAIGYQVVEKRDKVILIIDFGGSTLNSMIVRVNIGEAHVVAKPERAQMLGGHDIDQWLAEHLAKKAGLPVETGTSYRFLALAEGIKIDLSKRKEVPFELEGGYIGNITREELEELLEQHEFYKIVDRNISNLLRKGEKVGLKKDKIEAVLITGGSSQIPSFREKIEHIFPELRRQNLIYDHSPLSAVAIGSAIYGTKAVTDRHLSMAYAVRYVTDDKDAPYSYSIVLEKGESLPIEKSFKIRPARKLGIQNELSLELFEVPERIIVRRWVAESGIEFIAQDIQHGRDITLTGLKTVTLPFEEGGDSNLDIQLYVNETGQLSLKYGDQDRVIETGVRLQ